MLCSRIQSITTYYLPIIFFKKEKDRFLKLRKKSPTIAIMVIETTNAMFGLI